MLLSTALIICLSFLTVGLCARLNLDGHLNFIPMAMVVLAYVGYGLGFGVIPSLIAAESTCECQVDGEMSRKKKNCFQVHCGRNPDDVGDVVDIPFVKVETVPYRSPWH